MHKRIVDIIFELKSGCLEKEEYIREKLKLSPAEFRGILAILPEQIIPCNILSHKMGLSFSRGSRVVSKLMKNGYLKEVKIDGDRRVMNVTLAQKGIKIREKIGIKLDDCEKMIIEKITKDEKKFLINSLEKITGILTLDLKIN